MEKYDYQMDLFEYYMEERYDFSGWDFSYINNRVVMEPLPWSYESEVLPYLLESTSLLDIDTGGGELLSRFPLPKNVFATEVHPPNIEIAKAKLEPLGVNLLSPSNENHIPLDDASLDLIINRHGYFNIGDLYRLLRTGGYFITQQVGNNDNLEINEMLGGEEPEYYERGWSFQNLCDDFELHEFDILRAEEAFPKTRIYDVGAFLFYMKAIPWQYPGFDKNRFEGQIRAIHELIQEQGYWEVTSHRYLIVAQKR
jgi:SAM-dependent methyltransferase